MVELRRDPATTFITRILAAICAFIVAVSLLVPVSSKAATPLEDQSLEQLQGYLDPSPTGMDVRYAWTLEGGKGENVRIIDIEVNWNLNHTDLRAATSDLLVYEEGSDPQPDENINHGTAILGELVAADDGIGVTGIANRARLGLINPIRTAGTTDIARAVNRAADLLEPGDVILIEQQMLGPRFDVFTGRGTVPVEFNPAVFDAINNASLRGIVVVEAAANGFDNLDHRGYGGA